MAGLSLGMLGRLTLAVAVSGLLGACAGLPPAHPQEFSSKLPGNVLTAPDAADTAARISAAVPSALLQLESKLGYAPQQFTILVCGSACFQRHVPVPGAAAAQADKRIFINADLVSRDQIQGVLVHEMAHAAIEERRGRELHKVPDWANEGIAVWASGVGTEGCDGAGEGAQTHPLCLARKTSAWLDHLTPAARRCWLAEMFTGQPEGVCPPPPNFAQDLHHGKNLLSLGTRSR